MSRQLFFIEGEAKSRLIIQHDMPVLNRMRVRQDSITAIVQTLHHDVVGQDRCNMREKIRRAIHHGDRCFKGVGKGSDLQGAGDSSSTYTHIHDIDSTIP